MYYRSRSSGIYGCIARMLTKNMKIGTKRRMDKNDTTENGFELYKTNQNPSKVARNECIL